MKKEITGNWKKNFDYRFISGEDLLNADATLTIKAVGIDEAFNGKSKDDVVVVEFEETEKMIVLNKTNAKMLTKRTQSVNVEDWKGYKVTLYCDTVSAFGQQVFAVRIRDDQ